MFWFVINKIKFRHKRMLKKTESQNIYAVKKILQKTVQ